MFNSAIGRAERQAAHRLELLTKLAGKERIKSTNRMNFRSFQLKIC